MSAPSATAGSIRIVLVDTNHPGNIGATARAMKNMGLRELHLVRPKFFPNADATARASGADDVLEAAQVHEDFASAIADCGLVVGTSARQRHLPWDLIEPRECAQELVRAAQTGPVALVFGPERSGLTNAELARCNLLVTIPTDTAYSSLNLAMAVQILAYELWLLRRPGATPPPPREVPLASAAEMARFYAHLEQVLEEIDFRDRTGGGHLMGAIPRCLNPPTSTRTKKKTLGGFS
ncbi:MAG: tRNA (cytosine(32)/uridine(32)-2'-O)-methyltransferase TrmJ, partial [Proteobacteria bacterium]